MRPKNSKKFKPEDMLLRIIQVAEILAKGVGKISETSSSEENAIESLEDRKDIGAKKHESEILI